MPKRTDEELLAAGAYIFGAWLTTRRMMAGPFSSSHNAAPMVDLLAEFCRDQGMTPPDDWTELIKTKRGETQ